MILSLQPVIAARSSLPRTKTALTIATVISQPHSLVTFSVPSPPRNIALNDFVPAFPLRYPPCASVRLHFLHVAQQELFQRLKCDNKAPRLRTQTLSHRLYFASLGRYCLLVFLLSLQQISLRLCHILFRPLHVRKGNMAILQASMSIPYCSGLGTIMGTTEILYRRWQATD